MLPYPSMRMLLLILLTPLTAVHAEQRPVNQRVQVQPSIKLLDLNLHKDRQVIVDEEPGTYLGHPTTQLLEDGKTILCVYPQGHGRGPILYKRSDDGGRTWSRRLPTPENWKTSQETPTIHRVVDSQGKKRLILFSGLYPIRMAKSEDDGRTWSELSPVGDWGGIVAMSSVIELRTAPGHYLAMFHDDGRYFRENGKDEGVFTLFTSLSRDGGLTWETPRAIFQSSDVHLCEPGAIRSPDGKQIAVLLRENRRVRRSHLITSDDEGATWSAPNELPWSLSGDRHVGKYGQDGRLLISFRDVPTAETATPTTGDWIAWVGTYDELVKGGEGQYRVRIKDNLERRDCGYPGVEHLPDDTFVLTSYGHWKPREEPYILSVRITLRELDELSNLSGF